MWLAKNTAPVFTTNFLTQTLTQNVPRLWSARIDILLETLFLSYFISIVLGIILGQGAAFYIESSPPRILGQGAAFYIESSPPLIGNSTFDLYLRGSTAMVYGIFFAQFVLSGYWLSCIAGTIKLNYFAKTKNAPDFLVVFLGLVLISFLVHMFHLVFLQSCIVGGAKLYVGHVDYSGGRYQFVNDAEISSAYLVIRNYVSERGLVLLSLNGREVEMPRGLFAMSLPVSFFGALLTKLALLSSASYIYRAIVFVAMGAISSSIGISLFISGSGHWVLIVLVSWGLLFCVVCCGVIRSWAQAWFRVATDTCVIMTPSLLFALFYFMTEGSMEVRYASLPDYGYAFALIIVAGTVVSSLAERIHARPA